MQLNPATSDIAHDGSTVVVGVFADNVPTPGTESIFESVPSTFLEAIEFTGKAGQTAVAALPGAASILLVGLGEETSFEGLRSAAGNAVRAIKTEHAVSYLSQVPIDAAVRAVVEGLVLGSYRFDRYKTDTEVGRPASVHLVGASQSEIDDASILAEATNLARDWVSTPAMDQSPAAFAEEIAAAAREAGIEAEVWDEDRIREEELGGVIGVSAGSDRPPRLVTLRYRPDDAAGHLGLVGKGIVFDSGGLSIKPAKSMARMKNDMAGAAAAAAAAVAIARLGLPIAVTTVIPLTDNVIGGDATRPGDVLRPHAGPTIEVRNTDAEGRLVLADALGLVQREEPELIVDIATLTGPAHIALGESIAAVFASGDGVADRVLAAARTAGEPMWEMPLYQPYKKDIESPIADITNSRLDPIGGAIHAALFLSHFAGDGPWAHLDIAGPADSKETTGEHVKGASGFGVRTLVEVARNLSETS